MNSCSKTIVIVWTRGAKEKGLSSFWLHRPTALVPSAGPTPRTSTGKCSENCLCLLVRNWKAAHSRVTPTIASPPTCPAPPGPPDPTSPDPTHLNNKQSRMCSGARRTSAVLHRPSLMKPTAYSKDFSLQCIYLLLLFTGFHLYVLFFFFI